LIRIRIPDEKLAIHNDISDLSISLPDFEKTEWECGKVLITENKINFLTLPLLSSAIPTFIFIPGLGNLLRIA
jgi:hypothetical protein